MEVNDVMLSSEECAVGLSELMVKGYIEFVDDTKYIVTWEGSRRAWKILKDFSVADRILIFEAYRIIAEGMEEGEDEEEEED
jgi:hypothetical protein